MSIQWSWSQFSGKWFFFFPLQNKPEFWLKISFLTPTCFWVLPKFPFYYLPSIPSKNIVELHFQNSFFLSFLFPSDVVNAFLPVRGQLDIWNWAWFSSLLLPRVQSVIPLPPWPADTAHSTTHFLESESTLRPRVSLHMSTRYGRNLVGLVILHTMNQFPILGHHEWTNWLFLH